MATSDEAVLTALRDREWHGFDLAEHLGVSPGRLYPTLARLEREGALESWWDEGEPPRRVYGTARRQGGARDGDE